MLIWGRKLKLEPATYGGTVRPVLSVRQSIIAVDDLDSFMLSPSPSYPHHLRH
jgi:hypothetical protein